MSETERAIYEIYLRDKFSAPLGGMEKKMNMFEGRLGGLKSTLLGVFGGSLLAGGVEEFVRQIGHAAIGVVNLGGQMEQTEIAFQTLLGSADLAKSTLMELRSLAEATPFSQADVIAGGRSLLAYQFKADELTSTLTMLGDVSAGLSVPINDMIYLYGTLKTQGKAMTKDIMQFASRGIPIYEELSKVLGVSVDEVGNLVTAGKVDFKVVERAFQNMTAAGSMFGGLMEKQAKSFLGRWSTLMDKFEIQATTLGMKMLPVLGKMLEHVIDIVDLIPHLDFSPITDTFEQLTSQMGEAFSVFRDLLNLFGAESMTTFDALTAAIHMMAFSFRSVTTPLRWAIQAYTQFMNLIEKSISIYYGLQKVLAGLFTRDFVLMGEGINQIGDGFKNMYKDAADSASEFWEKEKDGWKKVFGGADRFMGTADAVGATGPTQGGTLWDMFKAENDKKAKGAAGPKPPGANPDDKSTAAGVEKIQAGTRNVTVNIQTIKLADTITSNKADMSDARIQQMLTRAMVAAVNDVNLVGQ